MTEKINRITSDKPATAAITYAAEAFAGGTPLFIACSEELTRRALSEMGETLDLAKPTRLLFLRQRDGYSPPIPLLAVSHRLGCGGETWEYRDGAYKTLFTVYGYDGVRPLWLGGSRWSRFKAWWSTAVRRLIPKGQLVDTNA